MHGIDNEKTAFQIEAALIDAYPGLSNVIAHLGRRAVALGRVGSLIIGLENDG
jgi:hypothetical protein